MSRSQVAGAGSQEQIRQLLQQFDSDDDEHPLPSAADVSNSQTRLTGSRAARSRQHLRGATIPRRVVEVDSHLLFLKRVHGGTFPAFDSSQPDPGCAVEFGMLQPLVDPTYDHDAPGLDLDRAAQYDPEDPQVRLKTEMAREAHWKLTAPKGFASLEGIPELQQLLAYTAADVVHYAVDSAEGGAAGVFPWDKHPTPDLFDEGAERKERDVLGHNTLCDGSSLIGQLAPGLRLCLAAELATGLLCDSQPLPPDTPQHASALLLFLAAALTQAEQDCVKACDWPRDALWVLNPSLSGLRTLVDFFAVSDPTQILSAVGAPLAAAKQQQQQQSPGGGAVGDSGSSSRRQDCPDHYSPVHDAISLAVDFGGL